MSARWLAGRGLRALVAPLMMAGVLIGLGQGPALAAACVNSTGTAWRHVPSPSPGSDINSLNGVAAVSSCQAWAVGDYLNTKGPYHTLAEHWNGTAWQQVPSPSPGTIGNTLSGVAATSAANAWAVGRYASSRGGPTLALIEHWNGTAWQQVPSPKPSTSDNELLSVAATSATNAWAVGEYGGVKVEQTLIVHWNGTAWKQVPSPNPATAGLGFNELTGVAATSATNAWAVGDYINNSDTAVQTLIAHWNGTAWKQVPSPNPSTTHSVLFGVTATSATNAWAFGEFNPFGPGAKILIAHWNGTAWKQVPSPNPGTPGDAGLSGMTATSSTNAWAVGGYSGNGNARTLILRWTGTAWKQVPSPNPGQSVLSGVAATSSANIWAVGNYVSSSGNKTLTMHCC